ncbi:MAG: peptidoglycan bridge formation glycyltransferase FemA/FemB family protein [Treponema sp.]|jgi:lipid II:glycine glycyltransferase (peptidoglycan interpeptide bridge formation enzyme)|nr:peptidoglycan bridge formation glycyltransferase FemA/FemB family protein [Treponema sp.]
MEKLTKRLSIQEADLAVCESAASFLQSAMWGEFKSRFGWTAKTFLIDWSLDEVQEKTPLLVLCRRLTPGFSFAYVPWGPELPASFPDEAKPKIIAALAKNLKKFLTPNTVFVRFEPPWIVNVENNVNSSLFLAAGLKQTAITVQAPDTVIVDLSPSCGEILLAMKPKWRYNISLAVKKDVQVNTGTIQELDVFYELLKETAIRDGIAIHNFSYYKTLFELCQKQNNDKLQIRLYIANHDDDVLAAIIVLFRGKEATYLYGASSNKKRNLMAPYALQWKVMQDAKEAGCLNYDLFGIPPNDDPNHPMAGLYRFKTGFGGKIIHRPGAWDFPYKSFFYTLFKVAEKVRKRLLNRKKKIYNKPKE